MYGIRTIKKVNGFYLPGRFRALKRKFERIYFRRIYEKANSAAPGEARRA